MMHKIKNFDLESLTDDQYVKICENFDKYPYLFAE